MEPQQVKNILLLNTPSMAIGIPLELVEQVVPLTAIKEIPEAPPWFSGILNLNGLSIPILDLMLRLGLGSPPPYTLETPMIILNMAGPALAEVKRVGVIVPEIAGISSLTEPKLQQSDLFQQTNSAFLGIGRMSDNKLVMILDAEQLVSIDFSMMPEALLFDPEQLTPERWANWGETG